MKKTPIKESDWKWFGHAAHFICGQWCRFHLATVVGKYLISTVGEYWPERQAREIFAECRNPVWLAENRHLKGDNFDRAYMKKFGFEEIGLNRKYETMVFKAGKICDSKECHCGLPAIDSDNLDFQGYNTAGDAAKGHFEMCREWSAK